MSEKIYANGVIVKKKTTEFGEILKVSIKVAEFAEFVKQNKKEDGWINLDIVPRREASSTGQTHYVALDSWKPDPDKASKPTEKSASKPAKTAKPANPEFSDDIPF